tara:strand:- start:241 stop:501 length:261 start_codon:yes stop_codon:yes gene_type:complete
MLVVEDHQVVVEMVVQSHKLDSHKVVMVVMELVVAEVALVVLHLLLVHLLQWSQELVEVAVEVLQEIQLKAVTKMADLLVMMVLKT